jgi:hypothetical protein
VELLLITLRDLAANGNLKAVKELERLFERCNPTTNNLGYLVVPETLSPEEWIRRKEIENKFKKPPAEYRPKPNSIKKILIQGPKRLDFKRQ